MERTKSSSRSSSKRLEFTNYGILKVQREACKEGN